MKRETYSEARARIFRECRALGFIVKDTLKVPQVVLENTKWNKDTLFFHAQAVYLNVHSTWLDIRGMSTDTFLAMVRDIQERRSKTPQ
jgi:hypothetical protein